MINDVEVHSSRRRCSPNGCRNDLSQRSRRHRVWDGHRAQYQYYRYYAPVIIYIGMSHSLSLLLSGINGIAYVLPERIRTISHRVHTWRFLATINHEECR